MPDSGKNVESSPSKSNVEGCRYLVDTAIPRRYANEHRPTYIQVCPSYPPANSYVESWDREVCLRAEPVDGRIRKVDMLHPQLTAFLHKLANAGIGEKCLFANIEWEFDYWPWLPAGQRELLEQDEAQIAEMEILIQNCVIESKTEGTMAQQEDEKEPQDK